ncbi:phosphoglycerate mutase-like protein [Piedraia hortae CBS 480.64]|uniref:Phosphoglycerate mutase-like protein n=1 Tax=Piedraia hortae CBS 480.64 TaxID=1314780 RepID=A0A6A7BY74_9PEZI|nr:phosphoglycerate mutase-like protein [Piedraia hortae CBS 480.64]
MGGNSPWIPKVRNVPGYDTDPPEHCLVDQVHMMSRHAERYPTNSSGIRMLQLYQHIAHSNVTFQGSLSFLNKWDFFMNEPAKRFENLVATGPNAGTLEAFATGVKLRTRYEALLWEAIAKNATRLWAGDSNRVIETAKYFSAGFYGIDWERISDLKIIPETADQGGNTLTPGRTCRKYRDNEDDYGHDYGVRMLYKWREEYLPPIVRRLAKENPQIVFTQAEVYSMQEICGFESLAKGKSDWCDVFTHKEWEQFEYARDLLHYYRSGEGNPFGVVMGSLWLNSTAYLLEKGPEEAGPLFFSFVHDGDIVPFLAALDLFPQPTPLESSHILENRTWRTSDIVPMGGRVILERLACPYQECWDHGEFGYPNHVFCNPPSQDVFIRVNVNDAIVPIPWCEHGPGGSCPLSEFLQRVRERVMGMDFLKTCGLSQDMKDRIEFLHQ